MLQLTISAEQVGWLKELVIVPLATWFFRWSIKALKTSLNEIITDNVNRVREELKTYIEDKFNEHEANAFSRIANLETAVKNGVKNVGS